MTSLNGRLTLILLVTAVTWACGGQKPGGTTDADTDTDADAYWDGYEVPPDVDDADGDAISDADEGRSESRDTDSDTIPDYQDEDSDGDTISDIMEAGDSDPTTPPRDTDSDTTPDYRDTDSDDNGVPDATEAGDADVITPPVDTDLDGIGDWVDLDNDGDGLTDTLEIGTDPTSPVDFDGDGTPDYMDTDSDGDWIPDASEASAGADVDTDEDTIPDRHDDDTDGDGLTDAQEAGDEDLSTPPLDTDDDEIPNFRDRDSDGDGLGDAEELAAGTDPTLVDSDGDGVTDLIEVAYGSDPNDDTESPRTFGDFVFVVPYNDPADPPDPPLNPDPTMDTLVFSTDIQQADVFFLVDTTGSMDEEIDNLRTSLTDFIIPEIQTEITNVWFGVGGFDDYPVDPYGDGSASDLPFYLVQRMTNSATDAQTAVNSLAVHSGADLPESTVPALWAVATGGALDTYVPAQTACDTAGGEYGYPCFRSGAVPIIVLITDAAFHNDKDGADAYSGVGGPPPYYTDAVMALDAIHARVVGVCSGTAQAMMDMEDICTDTGAVYEITPGVEQPLLSQIMANGMGLSDQVVLNVKRLANQVPIEISTVARDVDEGAGDTVDATVFIDRIVPNTTGGVEDPVTGLICVPGLATGDTTEPPDGVADVFTSVLPGTTVCFDIYPQFNDMVPHIENEPQLYRAEIDVVGDGITVLDTRSVFFLIPPYIEEIIIY